MNIAAEVVASIQAWEAQSPRSKQAKEGILGPSDIGFCRQKAALVTQEVQPTDNPPKWSANVGTAIHNFVERAVKTSHPDWIVGSIDDLEVTATLPSGATIKGHPDIVIPSENTVIDIKTVDGLSYYRNQGPSLQHQYQRHLYALALIQNGTFTTNKPVIVGNLYMDRSGKEPTPILQSEEFNETLTNSVDSWVSDVIYAVQHKEEASKDIAPAVCERICEFFTVCRGSLPDENSEPITDSETIAAVNAYVKGSELEKEGASLKKQAKTLLEGVSGNTPTHQVRWVEIQPTIVAQQERAGFMRMDVRALRTR